MSWGLPGPCFVPPQGSRSSLATSGCMALSWTLFLSAPSQYHSQSHVSTWSEQILLPPTDFHSSLVGNLDFGLLISVNCSQLSIMISWETAIYGLLCSETFGLLVPNSCPITVWYIIHCVYYFSKTLLLTLEGPSIWNKGTTCVNCTIAFVKDLWAEGEMERGSRN